LGLLRTSDDQGRTWSAAARLPDGILGPIRAKPVELAPGVLLAGSSTEDAGWVVHMERLAGTWSSSGPLNDPREFGAIHDDPRARRRRADPVVAAGRA
jgi:hypothetical protein